MVDHSPDDNYVPVTEPVLSDPIHEGKSFTATLKPGDYYAVVIFAGTVDGMPAAFADAKPFEVKDDTTCVPKPGNGKDDLKQPETPKQGKEMIDEVKNGGNLPKTATNFPNYTIIGILMLALGLGTCKIRSIMGK